MTGQLLGRERAGDGDAFAGRVNSVTDVAPGASGESKCRAGLRRTGDGRMPWRHGQGSL